MRDGVKLACDIYRPDAEGKFPALLSMSPYGKDKQSLNISPKRFNAEFAPIEAGDTKYFVSRGYVHVIVDGRGTGYSEGRYDVCSKKEQEDGYDIDHTLKSFHLLLYHICHKTSDLALPYFYKKDIHNFA